MKGSRDQGIKALLVLVIGACVALLVHGRVTAQAPSPHNTCGIEEQSPAPDPRPLTFNTCGVEEEGTKAQRHEGTEPFVARPSISKAQARAVLAKEKKTAALLGFAGYYPLPLEKYLDGAYPSLMFEVGGVTVQIYAQGASLGHVQHETPIGHWKAGFFYPMCETLTISCQPACAAVYWEASGGQFHGTFSTESGQTIADGCGEYVDPPGHCFGIAAPAWEGVIRGELSGAQMYGNLVVQVE